MKVLVGVMVALVSTSATAQNYCQYNMPYQPASCYQQQPQPQQQPANNWQNYIPAYQVPQYLPNTNAPGYLPGQFQYEQEQAQLRANLCRKGNQQYC